MKTKTVFLLIFTFPLWGLGGFSCSKDDSKDAVQLPPATQTGANTFGAIINGQIMVPRNSIGYIPPGSTHYAVNYWTSGDFKMNIRASDKQTKMGSIYIFIYDNMGISLKNYNINNSNGSFGDLPAIDTSITAFYYDNSTALFEKYLSIENSGTINITKNNVDIISGTFSCKLKSDENSNKIIEIKEGRFDFTKSTINSTDFK